MRPRTSRAFVLAASTLFVGRIGIGCASNDDGASPFIPASDASTDVLTNDAPGDPELLDDAGADRDSDATPTCSSEGWCRTALPAPGSFEGGAPTFGSQPLFEMNSVWVASDGIAWSVTTGGHVLRWDATGWRVVTVVSTALRSVWGTSPTDLWISGDNGLVLHGTISGGALTLAQVPLESYSSLTKIWGTSATDIWVAGSDGVFHLEAPDAGEPSTFVRMNLPSDWAPNTNIQPTTLWASGNDVWVAASEQTWCDPINCEYLSKLVVFKWKGGNDGESSWDRISFPMGVEGGLPSYCTITAGGATSEGIQLVGVRVPDLEGALVLRIAADESLLPPGEVQHDGAHAWTAEIILDYLAPGGIWATDRTNIWLAGSAGVRRHDGMDWQVGRLALVQGEPLLKSLHSIHAAVGAPPNPPDMWIVGDDVALHRTVNP